MNEAREDSDSEVLDSEEDADDPFKKRVGVPEPVGQTGQKKAKRGPGSKDLMSILLPEDYDGVKDFSIESPVKSASGQGELGELGEQGEPQEQEEPDEPLFITHDEFLEAVKTSPKKENQNIRTQLGTIKDNLVTDKDVKDIKHAIEAPTNTRTKTKQVRHSHPQSRKIPYRVGLSKRANTPHLHTRISKK